jgi:Ca-activated chloride channel family protein
LDLPFVSGYDRSFLIRTSTHPPVFIATNEHLPTVRVPLSTSVASVRRTEQLVEVGRLPDQQEIRPEDFLAAINYDFAPPSNEDVSVTLAAGRAPFGTQKRELLQVGVKAARRFGDLATHTSLVVDVSQSMRQQGRLDTLREALLRMFEHLDPDDSISLIAVNHEVTQQIDFATADQQDQLAKWLRALRAGGGDQLVVGVQSALPLALEAPRDASIVRQMVVVTDGAARLTAGEQRQLGELMGLAVERNVRTTMLRIGDDVNVSDWPSEGDASITTVTPDELPWTLVELVTDVSSLVARQAQVQVTFNPKAVLAYRLVGHGPSAATGLGDEVWATDLRSGQEATLLFEVWMHDSNEDEIASAEVHWRVPAGSVAWRHARRQSLSRYDVATIWSDSPPSLQAAAIAAEIGERLRGVGTFEVRGDRGFRERRKPVGWNELLDAAAAISPVTAAREDFRRLIDLVRKMEELRRRERSSKTL